jgi:hypothetical protein
LNRQPSIVDDYERKQGELRNKNVGQKRPDPMDELEKVEARLQQWLAKSRGNASLFRSDPIAALRAAGVDLEDDTMMELEIILSNIARRLR